MSMDTFLMEQAQREAVLYEQQRRDARLVVAGAARDAEDAAQLLDALGLIER